MAPKMRIARSIFLVVYPKKSQWSRDFVALAGHVVHVDVLYTVLGSHGRHVLVDHHSTKEFSLELLWAIVPEASGNGNVPNRHRGGDSVPFKGRVIQVDMLDATLGSHSRRVFVDHHTREPLSFQVFRTVDPETARNSHVPFNIGVEREHLADHAPVVKKDIRGLKSVEFRDVPLETILDPRVLSSRNRRRIDEEIWKSREDICHVDVARWATTIVQIQKCDLLDRKTSSQHKILKQRILAAGTLLDRTETHVPSRVDDIVSAQTLRERMNSIALANEDAGTYQTLFRKGFLHHMNVVPNAFKGQNDLILHSGLLSLLDVLCCDGARSFHGVGIVGVGVAQRTPEILRVPFDVYVLPQKERGSALQVLSVVA